MQTRPSRVRKGRPVQPLAMITDYHLYYKMLLWNRWLLYLPSLILIIELTITDYRLYTQMFILAGYCEGDGYHIGFGECAGKILPALDMWLLVLERSFTWQLHVLWETLKAFLSLTLWYGSTLLHISVCECNNYYGHWSTCSVSNPQGNWDKSDFINELLFFLYPLPFC